MLGRSDGTDLALLPHRREFEPHSKAQRLTVSIDEDPLVWRTRLAFQQLPEQRHGFRPERTDPFLAALAIEARGPGVSNRIALEHRSSASWIRAPLLYRNESNMVAHPGVVRSGWARIASTSLGSR
jgi:hypothetical protein